MKLYDLQRADSIIHSRLFVYGDEFPPIKGVQQDARIHGYRLIVSEDDQPASLYETNDWGDQVEGILVTELTNTELEKAEKFYEGKQVVVMPVICKTVRIESQVFM